MRHESRRNISRIFPAALAALLAASSLALFASPHPSAPPPPNPPALPPFPEEEPEDLSRIPRIADYRIRARVNLKEGTISGQATLLWRNHQRTPASELCLHLYLNAFRGKDTLFYQGSGGESRGNPISLTEPGSISAKEALLGEKRLPIEETNDGTTARVLLPAPVPPGESVTLTIPFFDTLPPIAARTGKIPGFLMGAQWFPKAGVFTDAGWVCEPYYAFGEFFSDFGDYEVILETPPGALLAASGGEGERLEDTEDGFEVRRFRVGPVHDFAFALGDKLEEIRETVGHVRVRMVFPRGERRSAERHLEAVRRGLPLFESWLGRYPYDDLTVVEVPKGAEGAGGMEYPTLITTWGERTILHLLGRLPEQTTLHELAHQWFYGLVATDEVAWPFLDEGLTTYVSEVALEKLYGALLQIETPAFSLTPQDPSRLQILLGGSAEPIAQAAHRFRSASSYGAAAYGRTAMALSTLAALSPPGALDLALGRYARQFRFQHPTPDDLFSSLSASLGRNLDPFRKEVFESPGEVDYIIKDISLEPLPRVQIERRGTVILPARVVVYLSDRTTLEAVWTEEEQREDPRAWKEFSFPEAKEPRWAEVVALPLEARLWENARWFPGEGGEGFWKTFGTMLGVGGFTGELLLLSTMP